GFDEFRPQLDCPSEVLDGTVMLIELRAVGLAPPRVGLGKIRQKCNGSIEVSNRRFRLVHLPVDQTSSQVHLRIIRLEYNGLVRIAQSLFVLAEMEEGAAA